MSSQLSGACSAAEEHMRALMERLPQVEEDIRRLEASRSARRLLGKYSCVDDLEEALAVLEAQDPETAAGGPRLHAVLLGEKRAALARERARFDHDLARSGFTNVAEAGRARLSESDARALEGRVNRYREDYAYTLRLCEAEAGREAVG